LRDSPEKVLEPAAPVTYRAMKYLALGWWQMTADVVCSGWNWKSSLTARSTTELEG